MADWKGSAQSGVTALQQWYPGVVGLYAWDPGDEYIVTNEANIANPNKVASDAIKLAGLWNNLCDTLRWWNSANAITALLDYMLITGDHDPAYLSAIENTFTNAPSAWRPQPNLSIGDWALIAAGDRSKVIYNTNFLDEYYDDDGWWALAWIKAFDLTGDKKYLTQSTIIFNEMTSGWDTVCGGGIYWQKNRQGPDGKSPYKNSVPNELFLAVAAALYVRLKEPSYLD